MSQIVDIAALLRDAAAAEREYQETIARAKQERNERLQALHRKGLQIKQLMEATGLSRETIRQILNPEVRADLNARARARRSSRKEPQQTGSRHLRKLNTDLTRLGIKDSVTVTEKDGSATVTIAEDASFDSKALAEQLKALGWDVSRRGNTVRVAFPGA